MKDKFKAVFDKSVAFIAAHPKTSGAIVLVIIGLLIVAWLKAVI